MKRAVIVIIILAVLGAGGYFLYQRNQQQQQAELMNSLQTVAVERGPLTASIGATGVVRSNQSANLSWQTAGTVEEILAQVGDEVSTDDLLAFLKKTSLQQNIILAEAELIDARQNLEDLQKPASELDLAQAREAILTAEKAVEDAEKRLNGLQTSASQADIDAAASAVVIAKDRLDRAQKAFRPYENKDENNIIRANLQSALAQAQQNYDAAVRRLNNLRGTASATDVSLAQADLEVSQARYADAQETYDTLLNGADADDIQRAETRIAAIEATLNQSQILAPFSGTVTEVDSKKGDQANPGIRAFRIDDLSRLLVDVGVSEVDINRIQPGQEATLIFDGIPNQDYKAVVVGIDPVGTNNQGIVEFNITLEIVEPDNAVRPGMTAAVNIIINQLEDVLQVPNRAVRIVDGERVVYILKNGELVPVPITLGVSSDLNSEVLNSELAAGDQVVLNPPQVFSTDGPPPFVNR
jgi:HlyD family secretion protein